MVIRFLLTMLGGCLLSAQAETLPPDTIKLTRLSGFSETVTLDQLAETVPKELVSIDLDFMHRSSRRYQGFDFKAVLTAYDMPLDASYLLICEDGYTATLDARYLGDEVNAYLAVSDADVDGDARWSDFILRGKSIVFSPTYLTWQSHDTDEVSPESLIERPWPYGLVEIRQYEPDSRYQMIKPKSASVEVGHGFEVYKRECGKCHQVQDVGGKLGPRLDTSPLVIHLPEKELKRLISEVETFFPESKMPTYVEHLEEAEVDAVIAYLRYFSQQ